MPTPPQSPERPDLEVRDSWKELPVPGRPLRGFICIVREDPQIHTRLFLTPDGRRAQRSVMGEARVLAVGGAILHSSGEWIEPQVEKGDRILTQGHNHFCTHKVTPNEDTEYEFIQFGQVAAVLEEAPEANELGADWDPEELDEPEAPRLVPLALDADGNQLTE